MRSAIGRAFGDSFGGSFQASPNTDGGGEVLLRWLRVVVATIRNVGRRSAISWSATQRSGQGGVYLFGGIELSTWFGGKIRSIASQGA